MTPHSCSYVKCQKCRSYGAWSIRNLAFPLRPYVLLAAHPALSAAAASAAHAALATATVAHPTRDAAAASIAHTAAVVLAAHPALSAAAALTTHPVRCCSCSFGSS